MAIQWFPGHMHKARRQIEEILPQVDVIIEVLDARLPFSSENPMIAELRGEKPSLKLLNKADLADADLNQIWIDEIEQRDGQSALAIQPDKQDLQQLVIKSCANLLPPRHNKPAPTALIAGIPNVGKSTLINRLAGRTVAKTGNEPAVTQSQQRVGLADGFQLLDTPGMLWARVRNEASGYRLALTGAIKDTALDHTEVAFFAASALADRYPSRLTERYQLDALPSTELELLQAIGARRGCLGKGGEVSFDKVAKVLLTDLRSGKLGRLTLETPEMIQAEMEKTEQLEAERAAKKEARLARRKKKK
ncbi:MAG: ribosome biogenesis GTPase YlqF [Granulosicoccaceae bacterium]